MYVYMQVIVSQNVNQPVIFATRLGVA